MENTIQDVWKDMEKLVESGKTYLFEPVDEDDPFEPFEGKPIEVRNEMAVEITKGNDDVKKGMVIWIDVDEYCFMSITEV